MDDARLPQDRESAETSERSAIARRGKSWSRRVFLDPSTPSARSIFRTVVIVVISLAVAGFIQNILSSLTFLLFIIVLSIFFAYFVEPLVRLVNAPFQSRGGTFLPRPLAIAVAYLIIFGSIALAIYFIAPIVVQQAQELASNLPNYVSGVEQQLNSLNAKLQRYQIPPEFQTQIREKINTSIFGLSDYIAVFLQNAAFNIVTFLPWLVLIPILGFFFLKDVNLYKITLLRVFPSGKWRARIEEILFEVNSTLRAYVKAQLLSCVLIGVVCTIGFWMIGVSYAVLLGILAGIFEFVPLIGPLTIAILVVSVAGLSNSASQAIVTGIFLLVLRLVHDYVTYPRIVRGGIHLHPLAIILSVLAGEQVAGIPGVFLSIPIVAILTVLYRHLLIHRGHKGIIAGILEPEKNETTARIIEDKPIESEVKKD